MATKPHRVIRTRGRVPAGLVQVPGRPGYACQPEHAEAVAAGRIVYVGRPTKWGNPFPVGRQGPWGRRAVDAADAVKLFRYLLMKRVRTTSVGYPLDSISDLRGAHLACWCPLDGPCHADVLIEEANRDD